MVRPWPERHRGRTLPPPPPWSAAFLSVQPSHLVQLTSAKIRLFPRTVCTVDVVLLELT